MINREHKDRLFRLIFGEEKNKRNLLVLLIDFWLTLYEQQSTWNPNTPVRGMFYFSGMYEKYIALNKLNTYGSKLIKLPTPQYIVFYNGMDERMDGKDEVKLRLSDAFVDKSVAGEFEWTATVKNINLGRNNELMEKCRPLMEYATLVDKIRRYKEELGNIEKAVNKAVDECIKEGILADFLIGHKAEVMDVCLTEYDEMATMNAFKEEAVDDVLRLQKFLLDNNRIDDLRRTTYDKEYRDLLISKLPHDEN